MNTNILSTNCITNVPVGKVLTLYNTTTAGTVPYTIKFRRNGVDLPGGTFTSVGEGITKSIQYTVLSTDMPSIMLDTVATDSCSTSAGGPKSTTESCTINVLLPICYWITNLGGISSLTIPYIFELVYAYLGLTNIGFVPTITEITGCVYYWLGFIGPGNTNTGCNF